MKELIFYFLAVVTIAIFGFLKKISWAFVAIYFTLYGFYWIATLVTDKMEGNDGKENQQNEDLEGDLVNEVDEENK